MNNTVSDILQDLDALAPPPRQTLTLPEVGRVIGVAEKTLRNNLAKKPPKMPFPVLKVGGKVLVSKKALAAFLAGLDPFKTEGEGRKAGRPKNSDALQRFAAMRLLSIFDEIEQQEQRDRLEEKARLIARFGNLEPHKPTQI